MAHDPDRRLDRLGRIEHALQQLTDRPSLRKNGDTWKQYLGKVFTVDRILMAVVIVFQLGGKVENYTSRVDDLTQREAEVTKQQQALSEQVVTHRQITTEQGESVDLLMKETTRLSKVTNQLEDRMNRTVTRGEFESALTQRILPRLDRIEKAQ